MSHNKRPYRTRAPRDATVADRLSLNSTGGVGGCILWQGRTNKKGYGTITVDGKSLLAHRCAWEDAAGRTVPIGMLVCHTCDTPACIESAHLFLGTIADNNSDRKAKSRYESTAGQKNGNAKMSDMTAAAILAEKGAQAEIAKAYGISQSTVSRIRSGKAWGHL